MEDETKKVLLSIYEDNRKLMLQLKAEVDQKRSCTDTTLNEFFTDLHETVCSQMSAAELQEHEKKVAISNLVAQNKAIKKYK